MDTKTEQANNDSSLRNNFDVASLLSLLGVGLLKFIDDKLRIRLKSNFPTYKKILWGSTIVAFGFFAAILICYLFSCGSPSFGNLKNTILGFIPVLFCVLTLITAKAEPDLLILSQGELDKKINEFTEAGMSPLGMIVGDMDFFGNVYSKNAGKKKGKKDITKNTQIKTIMDTQLDCIQIICKKPTTAEAKRRIGYLSDTLDKRLQIKFFKQGQNPIPNMRGRIMNRQGMQYALITKKIRKPSQYEYREYAVDTLPGALFADLWNAVWFYGEENLELIQECQNSYRSFVEKKEGEE